MNEAIPVSPRSLRKDAGLTASEPAQLKHEYQQTPLGIIPANWTVSALHSIATKITDGEHLTPRRAQDGYYLLSARNILNGCIDVSDVDYVGSDEFVRIRRRCNPEHGDVLISCSGTIGRVALVPPRFDCVLVRSAALIKVDARAVCPLFLQYQLQSDIGQKQIAQSVNQGAQPNLFLGHIEQLSVALAPLPEQRAIAAALSDVDALIGALDRLIAKKRDLKQAAMQQLLTGQTRLPGFKTTPFRQTEAGMIPDDWEIHPLLSVLQIANGQVDPRDEPYASMTLVAPDHIESSRGRLLARETAAQQKAISGKYPFAKGDIIYSKIRPYLRKAIVADFDGLCSADMYPMKPREGVSAGFMLAVLLGHRFSRFAESVSVRSGMPKINRAELAECQVGLPSSREQTAIAEVLSDMDAEISRLEQRLEKTRLLKQGMMQELLTGRIRLV